MVDFIKFCVKLYDLCLEARTRFSRCDASNYLFVWGLQDKIFLAILFFKCVDFSMSIKNNILIHYVDS